MASCERSVCSGHGTPSDSRGSRYRRWMSQDDRPTISEARSDDLVPTISRRGKVAYVMGVAVYIVVFGVFLVAFS